MIIFACLIRHDKHVAVASEIAVDDIPILVPLLFVTFTGDLVEKLPGETDVSNVLLKSGDRDDDIVVDGQVPAELIEIYIGLFCVDVVAG